MPHRPSFAKHLSPAITLNGCKLPPGVTRTSDGLRALRAPEQGSSIDTLGKATSSGSYVPAKTCAALTTIATLYNRDALGNNSSPGGKCHRPGRCCGAGSGQGIIPALHRHLIDPGWAQALEKSHLSAFSKPKSCASPPLPLFLAAF